MVKTFFHIVVWNDDNNSVLYSAFRPNYRDGKKLFNKVVSTMEKRCNGEKYGYSKSYAPDGDFIESWLIDTFFSEDHPTMGYTVSLDSDTMLQDTKDGGRILFGTHENKNLLFDDDIDVISWMLEQEHNSTIQL